MSEEPASKKQRVPTQYEQLAALTTIVADTGEIAQIKKYAPTDATTNPSLLYKAAGAPEHQDLVDDAIAYGRDLKGGALCCTLGFVVSSSCGLLSGAHSAPMPCSVLSAARQVDTVYRVANVIYRRTVYT